MYVILRRASLHYLLRHPWLIGLSIVGVALGVAVVVAIDVANESARRAFKLSAETLSGKATHEIVGGPQGLAETVYRRLRVDASVRTSAPVVQGYASAPNFPRHTFHVLGIDPLAEDQFRAYVGDVTGDDGTVRLLAEPATALMTDRTARRLGIKVDDILTLSVGGAQHQVTLVGLIESDDALMRQALDLVLVTDIATAQELLGMSGRLSRIDLIIADNDRVLLKRIRAVLPEGATLMRAAGRSNAMDQMTRAFRVNLTALSLLALLVGMFLIYNIMTFSVIQRRSLIGTLRAIGVTRKEVFTHVIIEALAVGTVGTVLGIIVGIVLGNSLVERVVGTINDLYFTLAVSDIAVSWISLLKGIALGIGATTIAALLPAWEATRTPVGTVLRRSEIEAHARVRAPRAALAGAAIALLGAALLWMPTRSLLVSYLALFAIILGFVLLVPMATILLMRALRPLASAFGIAGRMASRGVTAALSRTGVAIAALAVAISATVGVDIMIQSFRHSFIDWLGATLRADIYVAAPVIETSPSAAMLKPELVARFKSIPGVATISTGRRVRLDADAGVKQLFILGTNRKNFASIQFKQSDPANVWEPFQNRDTVLVSEPYAYRHRVAAGDEVRLRTDRGERPFRVIGVYYDYGSDEGRLTLSRKTYDRHWHDPALTFLRVYAKPGVDVESLMERLRHTAGDRVLRIRSNRSLRAASLAVFDRTFAITAVLRLLATIVAFIGVLSALMALQLERGRELAILRATGMTPRQVWQLIGAETGLMGLAAGLFALPLGIIMALALILVINLRSFGWTLQVFIEPAVLLQGLSLALIAALLAGVYPALRMAQTSPTLALREE